MSRDFIIRTNQRVLYFFGLHISVQSKVEILRLIVFSRVHVLSSLKRISKLGVESVAPNGTHKSFEFLHLKNFKYRDKKVLGFFDDMSYERLIFLR